MWNGPDLKIRLRRLWPMLVCALLGTLPAAAILTQGECSPDHRTAWRSPRGLCPDWPHRRPLQSLARTEPLLGPLIGLTTGHMNGATGIFVVPGVPYVQELNLGNDELVQALAISTLCRRWR